ncbi:MAG: TonB-dependent receptor [Bacteroidales bacterium]|jgi:TonB-linked SusC/RagA family outer membrane protein|nr:TonB-dependent receptor [Bacteroidales bacterium]
MKKFHHQILFRAMRFFAVSALIVLATHRYATGNERQPERRQGITVAGTVTDENDTPLPGVNVVLKGTVTGVVTDTNGKYAISVPDGNAVLIFSFVGYARQEVIVGDQALINIVLTEDVRRLEEVVVIGYGTQKRKELTGSISSISAESLRQIPAASIDNVLQGNAAGVQVLQESGQPGGRVSIRIRGGSSIQGGNEPLYVVDGFPFYNNVYSSGVVSGSSVNPLASVNPADIESIDILKDAAATAIYGSRGANGVIIITTKKGEKGESSENAQVTYDVSVGSQRLAKKIDLLNAHDFAILRNDALYDASPDKGKYQYLSQSEIDRLGDGTDWQDEAFRKAWVQNHQLSVTGSSAKTRYAISGNYFGQDGIVRNTDFKRLSLRANIDAQVYDRLKVGLNLTASRSEAHVAPGVGTATSEWGNTFITSLLIMPPTATVYEPDGGYTLQNPFENIFANPVASLLEQDNRTRNYLALGSAFAEYTVIKGLTVKVLVGATINSNKEYRYIPSYIYEGSFSDGKASAGVADPYSWLNENTVTYATSIAQKHFFNFLAGFTQQQSKNEWLSAGSSNFVNDYLKYNNLQSGAVIATPGSDAESSALLSWLGRINYHYNDKYYISFSLRGDGSSRFGKERKWGYFPSAGVSWAVSNEDFFAAAKSVVDDLKIRLSYGKTGNQEIGSYQSLSTLAPVSYLFGNNLVTGFLPERQPNKDLGWETTYQTDLGFDAGFFKNRLSLTVDAYYKQTVDLLLDVQIPWTTGYSSSLQNYGSVENRGLEITLNSHNVKGVFNWHTGVNLSFNRNKVVKIGNEADSYLSGNYLVKVGEPLGTFYGCVTDGILQTGEESVKGVFTGSAAPKAGDRLYKDVSLNGSFTTAEDRAIIGSAQPDFIFGLSNTLGYKGFSLSFLWQGSVGNEIINANRQSLELFNGQQNAAASARDRWTPDHPSATIPRAKLDPAPVFSDRFVEDGSFIRLKTASLSYTLPLRTVKSIGLENVRIYLSGQNLLTFTRYSGFDPEVTSSSDATVQRGTDAGVYPIARNINAGVSITF